VSDKTVRLELTEDLHGPCWRIVWADTGQPTFAGFSVTEQNAQELAGRHHYAVMDSAKTQLELV
jgi:hypothetical protein